MRQTRTAHRKHSRRREPALHPPASFWPAWHRQRRTSLGLRRLAERPR